MVLNLRNLVEPRKRSTPLSTFTCHGVKFQSHRTTDYRLSESGYQDRLNGLDPQQDNRHYRQGFMEAIIDAGL